MKILILSSSKLEKDPRILRQIRALKDDHDLITCGLSNSGIHGLTAEYPILFRPSKNQPFIKRVHNFLKMKAGMYENLTWDSEVIRTLDTHLYDCIIVNDPREMPLAVELQKGLSKQAKIYFDLHEWFIELDNHEYINKIFRTLIDKYYTKADEWSTVNIELAELYAERYSNKPKVVTNAGAFWDLQPSLIDTNQIKIVHHGILNPTRKLEEMIRLMDLLDDRFSLDLYLVGTDDSYLKELVTMANKAKVRFLPPVKYDDIVPTLNGYDIGLFILQEDVVSYKYALPNKLFEFIQGRLAVAISPNISMKKVVEKYKLGIVGDDFSAESLADKLNELSAGDINEMKNKSHSAASKLNDEIGIKLIKQIVSSFDN